MLLRIIRKSNDRELSHTVCFFGGDDALAAEMEDAGARVVGFGGRMSHPHLDPTAIYRFGRFLRANRFDILHLHLPYPQIIGRTLGRLLGTQPIVSTHHSLPSVLDPVTRGMERMTRPLNTVSIAVSESVKRRSTAPSLLSAPFPESRWTTIYNGIDVRAFHEMVRSAQPIDPPDDWDLDSDPIFLNIGRYVPAKGQADLVRAMDDVVETHPRARLFIVGWGPFADQLRAEVRERCLEEHVRITGLRTDIERYYNVADVFVSSSTSEGFSIAYLEAMAAKRPLVLTRIPMTDELIGDDPLGYVVPPRNPSELARSMARILESDQREVFAENAYDRVMERFDISNTVEAYESLYRELAESA